MNKITNVFISLFLIVSMLLPLTGCGETIYAMDLMEGIEGREVEGNNDLSSKSVTMTDFALRLMKESSEDGKNTLVSPLSVLCALAMTMNGAKGETLKEMEKTIGMTSEELNKYILSYTKHLTQSEKCKLSLANSIWFRDDKSFAPSRDFLQINADYYGADIYKAPFMSETLRDINGWVKKKTDGMIPEILNEISADAVMYLINALCFDAKWEEQYAAFEVEGGTFTTENNEKQQVEFMYGTDSRYIEDENAVGFIKYYEGRKFAFAALLPNEGVSVSEYLYSLDANKLSSLLSNSGFAAVRTAIPKFETEYSAEMSKVLSTMGITQAFDPGKADFSGLGSSSEGNIFIGSVIHKTFITVNEVGTKAGAATSVEMKIESAPGGEQKTVYLDRPFVYMLIDCETNIPFFIGTLMNVK